MVNKHYAGLAKRAKEIEKRAREAKQTAERPSTKKDADFKKSLWYERLRSKNK